MGFPEVRLIHNKTNVDENITNRPVFDLIERTDWLKEQLNDLLTQSSKMFITEVPCSDECQNSNFVYYDYNTKKWEVAYSVLIEIGGNREEVPAPSCYVQGLIQNITGSAGNRIGTIYLYGLVRDVNSVNMTEENLVEIGKNLYLTARITHKGQGSYTPPVVEVFCGKFINDTDFLFTPDFRNLGEHHRHIWFDLEYDKWTSVAASEILTGAVTFTNASANVIGVGTLFTTELEIGDWISLVGDNLPVKILSISNDTNLALYNPYSGAGGTGTANIEPGHWIYPYTEFPIWPPISYTSAVMSINGIAYFHGNKFYLSSDGVHYVDPDYPPDPNSEFYQGILYYQVPWGQERIEDLISGNVDSLFARTQNLKIYKHGTNVPASSGDLEILSLPIFKIQTEDSFGSTVIKSLNTDTVTGDIQVFKGPVVERLYSGTPNVQFKIHTESGAAEYGLMDLYVVNQFDYSTDMLEGWIVWKDVVVDPITGEIQIARGRVVEYLYPKYDIPAVKNIFFTNHAGGAGVDFTGRLDLAIKQIVDNTTHVFETGSIIVKDIEISTEGNLNLKRGPVVETIYAQNTLKIYEHGTTTPATQGNIDLVKLHVHRVRFLHTGIIDPVTEPLIDIFRDDGYLRDELFTANCSIVQSIIRISSTVIQGSIAMQVWIDSSPDRELTALNLSLDHITNEIWNNTTELIVGAQAVIPGEKLTVKLIPSVDFQAFVTGDPDDIYTIECIFVIATHDV